MVLFNCKTINICHAKSSVDTVMSHCVVHSLWLGLALQTVPGAASVPRAHMVCAATRGGLSGICCTELKTNNKYYNNWNKNSSEGVRSKVRERTSTKTERSTDKKMCLLHSPKKNWG